jgi:hypothetical protein
MNTLNSALQSFSAVPASLFKSVKFCPHLFETAVVKIGSEEVSLGHSWIVCAILNFIGDRLGYMHCCMTGASFYWMPAKMLAYSHQVPTPAERDGKVTPVVPYGAYAVAFLQKMDACAAYRLAAMGFIAMQKREGWSESSENKRVLDFPLNVIDG